MLFAESGEIQKWETDHTAKHNQFNFGNRKTLQIKDTR